MKQLLIVIALFAVILPFASYGISSFMSDILYEGDTFYEDMTDLAQTGGFSIEHPIGTTFDPFDFEICRTDFVTAFGRTYVDMFDWTPRWQPNDTDYNITMFDFVLLPLKSLIEYFFEGINFPWE